MRSLHFGTTARPRLLTALVATAALVGTSAALAPASYADDTGGDTVSWFASYYNATGIGDRDEGNADLDGLGNFYLRDLLAGAGLAPGTDLTIPDDTDLHYVLGGAQPGLDTYTPHGETTDVSASMGDATKFALVGTGTNGSPEGTLELHYADGSSDEVTFTLGDWCGSAQGDNVALATFPERGTGTSVQTGMSCSIWRTKIVTLSPTSSLESITWPANGDSKFHVLAIASDGTPSALTATTPPALPSSVAVGQVVTLDSSPAWDQSGDVTTTYQWLVDGEPVAQATSPAYVPRMADEGKQLSVQVTGVKGGYVPATTTTAAVTVAPGTIGVLADPTVAGTPQVGSALTAVRGSYDTDLVREDYQWSLDGTPVAGATSKRFTPAASAAGKTVSLDVVSSKDGYTSVDRTVSVGIVAKAPVVVPPPVDKPSAIAVVSAPKVKGKARVGKRLHASSGSFSVAGVQVSYRWFRGAKAVAGKKGAKASYKVRAKDKGKRLHVQVTASKAGYTPVSVSSKTTAKVKKGKIKVTKKAKIKAAKKHAKVGKKLKVTTGKYKPKKVKVTYRWFSGKKAVKGKKGKKRAYTVRKADAGKKLRVKITVTKKGYKKHSYKTKKTPKVKG